MNKSIFPKVALSVILSISNVALAQSTPQPTSNTTCAPENEVLFAYFNGVQTSKITALTTLHYWKARYGVTSPVGDKIIYEAFYNETGPLLEDFGETFEARLAEQGIKLENRWEIFLDSLNESGIFSTPLNTITNFVQARNDFREYVLTKIVSRLANIKANPPTAETYARHRTQLDESLQKKRKILMVPHSQGNLFMNKAFEYVEAKSGIGTVKAVHIAPASVFTKGNVVLANKDLVITRLGLTGSVPGATDEIPEYLFRDPGEDFETDWLGHALLAIYLNKTLSPSSKIDTYVKQSFTDLIKPASSGGDCLNPNQPQVSTSLEITSFSCTSTSVPYPTVSATGTVTGPAYNVNTGSTVFRIIATAGLQLNTITERVERMRITPICAGWNNFFGGCFRNDISQPATTTWTARTIFQLELDPEKNYDFIFKIGDVEKTMKGGKCR